MTRKAISVATGPPGTKTGVGPKPALWIDWVEWEGPLRASSGDSTFTNWWVGPQTTPDESTRARQILEQFAVNAFRGVPAESDFIDRLAGIFENRRAAGDSFDTAIRLPLSIVLASPGFLYLNEPTGENERRELTDRELAVRLAYFLWSSPPDRELLDLASRGELSNPDILRQQVDRLITDSPLRRVCRRPSSPVARHGAPRFLPVRYHTAPRI